MKLTVKLFAYFRDNRFITEVREYPKGTTVLDIINDLEINPEEIGVTMINSRHCGFDDNVSENDNLAIFPVVGGG